MNCHSSFVMMPVYIVPNPVSLKNDERCKMSENRNPVQVTLTQKPVQKYQYGGYVDCALNVFPVFSFHQTNGSVVAGNRERYENQKGNPAEENHRLRKVRENRLSGVVFDEVSGEMNR